MRPPLRIQDAPDVEDEEEDDLEEGDDDLDDEEDEEDEEPWRVLDFQSLKSLHWRRFSTDARVDRPVSPASYAPSF